MQLLQERANAHVAQQRATFEAQGKKLQSWVRPLPSMMVRDGDEQLVDMAAIGRDTSKLKAASRDEKPAPKPRRYLPSSHWRTKLDACERKIARLERRYAPPTDDPAAFGGNVHPSLRSKLTDAAIAEMASLYKRREGLQMKFADAQRREKSGG